MPKLVEGITLLLVANVCAFGRQGLCLQDSLWTNMNSESLNNVLKHSVSWKSQKLVQFVNTLHGVVKAQFCEAKRSLLYLGEYTLDPHYQLLAVPRDIWFVHSHNKRDPHSSTSSCKPEKRGIQRSTNQLRTICPPKHKGKKPIQKKRKIATKPARTPKKPRHQAND